MSPSFQPSDVKTHTQKDKRTLSSWRLSHIKFLFFKKTGSFTMANTALDKRQCDQFQ